MVSFLMIIHVIICVFLIMSILLQSSKGGGLAGTLGGTQMGSVFGGKGAATFLSKVTMWLGVAFALTSLTIGLISVRSSSRPRSLIEQAAEQEGSTPATMLPSVPGEGVQETPQQPVENPGK